MGYALFAQRKLVLTGQINYVSLQQTQRANEQYILATSSLSLQQQLTSIQTNQALQLSKYYEDLANIGKKEDGSLDANFLTKGTPSFEQYFVLDEDGNLVTTNEGTKAYKSLIEKMPNVLEDYTLKEHTTYKVGGICSGIVFPKMLKEAASKEEANDIKAKLEAEGAKVTLK